MRTKLRPLYTDWLIFHYAKDVSEIEMQSLEFKMKLSNQLSSNCLDCGKKLFILNTTQSPTTNAHVFILEKIIFYPNDKSFLTLCTFQGRRVQVCAKLAKKLQTFS